MAIASVNSFDIKYHDMSPNVTMLDFCWFNLMAFGYIGMVALNDISCDHQKSSKIFQFNMVTFHLYLVCRSTLQWIESMKILNISMLFSKRDVLESELSLYFFKTYLNTLLRRQDTFVAKMKEYETFVTFLYHHLINITDRPYKVYIF